MSGENKALGAVKKHADEIRKKLAVPKQNEVFRAAVEAAYLAAMSDHKVDADERKAIVEAVETLSVGVVIEWETEALLDECEKRLGGEGAARAEHVGKQLASLGQPEAGLLLAAIVAHASGGIDEAERETLQHIGTAAGLSSDRVDAIVTQATILGG